MNVMGGSGEPANDTACHLALRFARSMPIRLAHVQHLVGSALGIVMLLYFVVRPERMPHMLSRTSKTLTYWMITFVIIHNGCLFAVEVWHEVIFTSALLVRRSDDERDVCDTLLVTTWKCLLLRIPAIASVISISGIFLLLTIDNMVRSVSTCTYERRYARLDAVALNARVFAFMFVFTASLTLFIFRDEDPHELKFYCVASSRTSDRRMMLVYEFLFTLDICCMAAYCVALSVSYTKLSRNAHGFKVNRKMTMRHNIATIRFAIASNMLRFVFVGTFLFSNFFLRLLFPFNNDPLGFSQVLDNLYVVQWYGCALASILYYWRPFLLKTSREQIPTGDQRHVHFNQLRKQWQ